MTTIRKAQFPAFENMNEEFNDVNSFAHPLLLAMILYRTMSLLPYSQFSVVFAYRRGAITTPRDRDTAIKLPICR